jgi:hypothetical protein
MSRKFKLKVMRETWAEMEFEVEAETPEEARAKGLEAAANEDWTGRSHDADYQVTSEPLMGAPGITAIVAAQSDTKPADWDFINGPESGVGVEYWLRNQKCGLEAYVVFDQGELTTCEITSTKEN